MWQEIEEEREDTSFVQMKRGRHRYPGLGTQMKLHWGSSRFFRRSGAAAGKFPPGELFPPAPRPSLPPFSRISLTLAFPSRPNPHHPCSNGGSSRRCFSDGTRCRPGRREVERASGRCRRRHHQHHLHNSSSGSAAAAAVHFGSCWATAAGTSCCRMASRTWWEWCDSFP